MDAPLKPSSIQRGRLRRKRWTTSMHAPEPNTKPYMALGLGQSSSRAAHRAYSVLTSACAADSAWYVALARA